MMDKPTKPKHYRNNGVETKEIIEDISLLMGDRIDSYEGFCIGNIIKYLTRYPSKGKLEDLEKAKEYIQFLIEHYMRRNFDDQAGTAQTEPE